MTDAHIEKTIRFDHMARNYFAQNKQKSAEKNNISADFFPANSPLRISEKIANFINHFQYSYSSRVANSYPSALA